MKKINVTETFLPPFEQYAKLLESIWESKWVTNRGTYVRDLEKKIKSYLGLKSNVLLTTNGTLALQIALKSIHSKKKKIITTPFSYVATVSAIVWENFIPIFADIEKDYLTLDPKKVNEILEKDEDIAAILPVHVYGNPADVEAFNEISKKFNVPIIYDAAHAFGVYFKEKPLFDFGDISITSFHATKIFQTIEGGAIFTQNKKLSKELFLKHNFGHVSEVEFGDLGINAKMNEFQAAMGLLVLEYFDNIISKRKKIVQFYNNHLDFTYLDRLQIRPETHWNYSYYPIIFKDSYQLHRVISHLNNNNVFPRRYFYPSLNNLPYVEYNSMPVSENIASKVLCLPMAESLSFEDLEKIISIINMSFE